MPTRIYIFDTTLRDGEQSPGASLNVHEKLEIARQLERLGVDVIEAGFPISSPDEFDAVRAIADSIREPIICGLARAKLLCQPRNIRCHLLILNRKSDLEVVAVNDEPNRSLFTLSSKSQ